MRSTCVPGRSRAPRTSGAVAMVTQEMMSAWATAASRSGTASISTPGTLKLPGKVRGALVRPVPDHDAPDRPYAAVRHDDMGGEPARADDQQHLRILPRQAVDPEGGIGRGLAEGEGGPVADEQRRTGPAAEQGDEPLHRG